MYPDRMNALLDRVTLDPQTCGGRPCLRDTRVRVQDVLDMLAGGAAEAEILADFSYLEAEDIRASLAYAAATLADTTVIAA